jgi:hypothetical protein
MALPLSGSSFRDPDWMLRSLMPVKLEGNMRLTLAATQHLLVEAVLGGSIAALPTD